MGVAAVDLRAPVVAAVAPPSGLTALAAARPAPLEFDHSFWHVFLSVMDIYSLRAETAWQDLAHCV